MSNLSDGAEIEAQLGDWPRRLLHVPSMRSYPWRHGAWYGNVKEPRYNAISYTWGRFQLCDGDELITGEQPSGLKVHGVDWDIPRVDPAHFTPEQLREILRAAMHVSQGYFFVRTDRVAVPETRDAVEFVWVDIACIDQRFNTTSMLEIGRQAQIFSRAECVYIWLSRTSTEILRQLWQEYNAMNKDLYKAYRQAYVPGSHFKARLDEAWLHGAVETIETLTHDPWFGSLWTLQEAFICRRAVYLSRDGDVAQGEAHVRDDNIFTLRTTVLTIAAIFDIARKEAERCGTALVFPSWHRLRHLFRSLGFEALSEENPMALYNAATLRRPKRETDRIYGIMQVFGFRLGESDPAAEPGVQFTLAELEEQLGAALVQFNPILSQSFINADGFRAMGEGWRPGPRAMTPRQEQLDSMAMVRWEPQETITSCQMECRRHVGVLWGHVAGLACSFDLFQQYRSRVESELEKEDPALVNYTSSWMALDSAPDLFPGLSREADYSTTTAVQGLLSTLSGRSSVKILHLGYWPDDRSLNNNYNAEIHYGLILQQHEHIPSPWRRLGIATWRIMDGDSLRQAGNPKDGGPRRSDESSLVKYESHLKDILPIWAPLLPNHQTWEAIEGLFS